MSSFQLKARSITLAGFVGFALGLVAARSGRAFGALPPPPTGVQVTVDQGIEFSTIRSPNNPGLPFSTRDWTGIERDRQGKGIVNYDYRIGRTEITTGQWLEFFNTFSSRPAPASVTAVLGSFNNFYAGPVWWGAQQVSDNPAQYTANWTLRTDVPNAAMIPVYGISWRTAAIYCNWLNNNKSSDWNALLSGAYDTSTWGKFPNGTYTDAETHQPGAKFWIPSVDEWGKAAFFDPNKGGVNQPGWWTHANASDLPPAPGYPGDPGAQSSTGIPLLPYFEPSVLDIPLGAYSAQSAWGLLDTTGGTTELVDEYVDPTYRDRRLTIGAATGTVGDPASAAFLTEIGTRAFAGASGRVIGQGDLLVGLRIAAAVPEPSALSLGTILILSTGYRRRR